MSRDNRYDVASGLHALRLAVLACRPPVPHVAAAGVGGPWPLLSEALVPTGDSSPVGPAGPGGPGYGDSSLATSSAESEAERTRLIALVELARGGDKEAFGLLFDHYHLRVYRFLHSRTSSTSLAEDLTSETFFRALRSMNDFRWQGRDFGAWLMTIARNLTTDHYRAGRTRLEVATEDMGVHDDATEGPEREVLDRLTNVALLGALRDLPDEQRDCLVMRFLQGMSIAETADVLERSAGAVKQLQLRAIRNLAKALPPEARQC
ncbi:sigma-70 family RNA polymerase sigma factor [Nocardioides houyundeii]|uniref:sigma-70 family RNA polymerase sigma factor n=1 Tax=Nocardioides houyundeii TaxID=2045452 RepID=UPI000DF1D096|nr:sigma-70 family RNA polymerase sigma factor [Nocardioides houyundeii]